MTEAYDLGALHEYAFTHFHQFFEIILDQCENVDWLLHVDG